MRAFQRAVCLKQAGVGMVFESSAWCVGSSEGRKWAGVMLAVLVEKHAAGGTPKLAPIPHTIGGPCRHQRPSALSKLISPGNQRSCIQRLPSQYMA